MGAGPIGLATALFARIEKANVVVADISSEKLAMCSKLFDLETLLIDKNTPAKFAFGFTHVLDATGNVNSMNTGLNYVAHGGTYTLISIVKENIVFSDPEFHKRETTLLSSRNALREDFLFVIRCIQDNLIDTNMIKTHSTTMENVAEDLPKWALERDTVIKAIINVN